MKMVNNGKIRRILAHLEVQWPSFLVFELNKWPISWPIASFKPHEQYICDGVRTLHGRPVFLRHPWAIAGGVDGCSESEGVYGRIVIKEAFSWKWEDLAKL